MSAEGRRWRIEPSTKNWLKWDAVPAAEPRLSPARAFVLQFYPETDVQRGHFVGRVEHVLSGQAARFDTLDTLMRFLGRTLTAVGGRARHGMLASKQ